MIPIPHTAMAMPRSPSGKISQRIACDRGMTGPPPRPWKTRITMRKVRLGARPERNEETVKSTVQIRKKRLRPRSPASQPVAGMITALAARKEVMTQATSSTPAESAPCM